MSNWVLRQVIELIMCQMAGRIEWHLVALVRGGQCHWVALGIGWHLQHWFDVLHLTLMNYGLSKTSQKSFKLWFLNEANPTPDAGPLR